MNAFDFGTISEDYLHCIVDTLVLPVITIVVCFTISSSTTIAIGANKVPSVLLMDLVVVTMVAVDLVITVMFVIFDEIH